jgi:hypothetical protein
MDETPWYSDRLLKVDTRKDDILEKQHTTVHTHTISNRTHYGQEEEEHRKIKKK